MRKKTIDFVVRVHTLPFDLRPPLREEFKYLEDTSAVYRRAIDSRLLWKVWMIDEYGHLWLEVNFENDQDEPEFHTLRIDEGTFKKITSDPYEVLDDLDETKPPSPG